MKTILLAVLLAACGSKSSGPTTTTTPTSTPTASTAEAGPDCEGAINNSMSLSKDMMMKNGVDEAGIEKMKAAGVQHCKDDKWPADVTKCMVDAKTMNDAQGCYGKLTPEQQQSMNNSVRA